MVQRDDLTSSKTGPDLLRKSELLSQVVFFFFVWKKLSLSLLLLILLLLFITFTRRFQFISSIFGGEWPDWNTDRLILYTLYIYLISEEKFCTLKRWIKLKINFVNIRIDVIRVREYSCRYYRCMNRGITRGIWKSQTGSISLRKYWR